MNKIKSLAEKHYYSVFFFLFIIIYSYVVPGVLQPWESVDVTQSFHAVDYSMGFCSRFLPGVVYQFLFGAVNEKTLNLYMTALMVLFFFGLSLVLEKFILAVNSEYRFAAMVILLFFLTGPATFSIYIHTLGMLDVYWVFAALLFIVLLSRKETYFLLFIPFVLCVLVYYVTWICYIPFFIILILYKISVVKTKKEKVYLWAALLICIIAAASLTLYFALFERENLTYTLEEFIDVLKSRGIDYYRYYAESMYYDGYGGLEDPNASVFSELIARLGLNFSWFYSLSKVSVVILLLPAVSFIYKFFFKQISQCDNTLRKFSYICMLLLFPGTLVFSFFTSTDFIRWTGHAFLPLISSFIYVLHCEGNDALRNVKAGFEKQDFKAVLIYLAFYMSIVYDPYII